MGAVEKSIFCFEQENHHSVQLRLKTKLFASPGGMVEFEYRVHTAADAADLITRFLNNETILDEPYGIQGKGLGLKCRQTFGQLEQS